MIYAGIDIAKLNPFASAISSNGEILVEPFKFTNDGDGFSLLVSSLISLSDDKDSIIIAKALLLQESFRFVIFYDLDLMDIKQLGRFHQKTIKQCTRLKIQLTSYIYQALPELQYFFKSGLHQKSVRCQRQCSIYSDNPHHCTERVTE